MSTEVEGGDVPLDYPLIPGRVCGPASEPPANTELQGPAGVVWRRALGDWAVVSSTGGPA
jgi:hypothetical protein